MSTRSGRVMGVNGNLVTVEFDESVSQNEVAYVVQGELRLIAEVIRVRGRYADMQVFESTAGITVGDQVEFAGDLLSVELGPGLLATVYDGLQNPLNVIAERHGFFLPRGEQVEALPRDRAWEFTPRAAVGDRVRAGDTLGVVTEELFEHRIMVPFAVTGARHGRGDRRPRRVHRHRPHRRAGGRRRGAPRRDHDADLAGQAAHPLLRRAAAADASSWSPRCASSTRSSRWPRAAPTASPGRSAPARPCCSSSPAATPTSTW